MKKRLFFALGLILAAAAFILTACESVGNTPSPFRPPTIAPTRKPLSTTTPVPSFFTPAPTFTFTVTPTGRPCSNDLEFVADMTVEDGTVFLPGTSIDKRWLVKNTGTCHWDAAYRLAWLRGNLMDAVQEQFLYPARAGNTAPLRIAFIAPAEAGSYESVWQAVDPDGNFFGDFVSIKIVVTP